MADNWRHCSLHVLIFLHFDILGTKGKEASSFCEEALTCTCMLAQALGNVLRTPMADIIPLMFNAGLTEALAEALQVRIRFFVVTGL